VCPGDLSSGEESGSDASSDEDWGDEVDGGMASSPKIKPKRSLYKKMKNLVSASNLMVKGSSKRKM